MRKTFQQHLIGAKVHHKMHTESSCLATDYTSWLVILILFMEISGEEKAWIGVYLIPNTHTCTLIFFSYSYNGHFNDDIVQGRKKNKTWTNQGVQSLSFFVLCLVYTCHLFFVVLNPKYTLLILFRFSFTLFLLGIYLNVHFLDKKQV